MSQYSRPRTPPHHMPPKTDTAIRPPAPKPKRTAALWLWPVIILLAAAAVFLTLYQPGPLEILPSQIQSEIGTTGALYCRVSGWEEQTPALCGVFYVSENKAVSAQSLPPLQNEALAWVFTPMSPQEPAEDGVYIPYALFGHTLLLGDAVPAASLSGAAAMPPMQTVPVALSTAVPKDTDPVFTQTPTLAATRTAEPTAVFTPLPTLPHTQATFPTDSANTPSPSPTAAPTAAPTSTPTVIPTLTPTPTVTPTATPAPTFTPTPTPLAAISAAIPASDTFALYPVDTRYFYQQLTPAQQQVFARVYDGAMGFESPIDLDMQCTGADLEQVMYVIMYDCPELFQIGSHYQYRSSSQAIAVNVTLSYQMTEAEYQDRLTRTLAMIDDMQTLPDFGATDYDHQLTIYRRIKAICTYDLEKPFCECAFSPYLNGYAKCDGYSLALMLALRYYGIPSALVSGDAEDPTDPTLPGAHSWNYVQIGGAWYQCDITWDDINLGTTASDLLDYLPYFNLTDEKMLRTRTIYPEDSTWNLPVCDSKEANFYVRQGFVLPAGADLESALFDRFTQVHQQQKTEFPILFESEADYTQVRDQQYDLLRQWRDGAARLRTWYYVLDDDEWLLYFYGIRFTQ